MAPTFFIAVSEATKQNWLPLRGDLADVCEVIPNGVDLETFSPVSRGQRHALREELGVPRNAVVAVFVGRFAEEKGVLDLVRAHRSLPPPTKPWLVLAGSPFASADMEYDARVRAEAGQKTIFLGHRSDVAGIINTADVVVVPSHAEAFGRVVVESLACDVPVIGSDVDGIAEILKPQFADLLFPPRDVDRLAQLLQTVAAPGFSTRFAGRCRGVAETFDLDECNTRIERVLTRVARRQRSRV